MVSYYLSSIILHFLFIIIVEGNNSLKILQINEPTLNICKNATCNTSRYDDTANLLILTANEQPNIVLWFSKFKTDSTIFQQFQKSLNENKSKIIVLPVFGGNHSQRRCYNNSLDHQACYFVYSVTTDIRIVILDTSLWLKPSVDQQSERQIEWLEKTLMESKQNQKKVIVVGYDAPGSLEDSNAFIKYAQKHNEVIAQLFENYITTVRVGIFGSKWIDSFRIVGHSKEGQTLLPLFISPTTSKTAPSSISRARTYTINQRSLVVENYDQWQGPLLNGDRKWTKMYDHNSLYGPKRTSVEGLYGMVQSLLGNDSAMAQKYLERQLGNLTLSPQCAICYILHLLKARLDSCLLVCSTVDSVTRSSKSDNTSKNNNAFYVLGVIIGFVVILVGIVLAVNKVYCSRQRNVFLTTLTLDVPIDIADDCSNEHLDGKLSLNMSTEDLPKPPNGHRVPATHESEQTYDYIRM